MTKPKALYTQVICVLAAIICSCSSSNNQLAPQRITVDTGKVTQINIDSTRLIKPEPGDSSMLFDICDIELTDSSIYIFSRNVIKQYDLSDGQFIGTLSGRGDAPDQYSGIQRFWAHGDTLYIYDANRLAIMSFGTDARFLSRKELHNSPTSVPQYIIGIPGSDNYLVFNSYMDNPRAANPQFSIYGADLHHRSDIDGRNVSSGAFLTDRAYADTTNARVLFWEAMRDTVFCVKGETIEPVYVIDFGENSLPDNIKSAPNTFDRIAMYQATEGYASLCRLFQYDRNGYLYFSYLFDGKSFLARYIPSEERTQVFHFGQSEDGGIEQTSFFKIIGNRIFVSDADKDRAEENPCLYVIDISDLQL